MICIYPKCRRKAINDEIQLCHGHRAVSFIETYCTHCQGEWAGRPFHIMPWQRSLLMRMYGTLDSDGKRQYKTVYCEVPKKNGKTELGAAVALIGLVADDETGAEVYSAAGSREQAGLVFQRAQQMVRNNDDLSDRLKIIDSRKRIVDFQTNSFYQVLSAEVYTQHGINPSTIVFDELHAQPNRELYDVLTFGTGIARRQQLIFIITTAGISDKNSIGYEVHDYARQVADGIIPDSTFLPILWCADEDADWKSENVWKKVNPALNIIFDVDSLRQDYEKVKNLPSEENKFRRFRLNQWVSQVSRYIPMDKWDSCSEEPDEVELHGKPCFAGLDLSSVRDLTALVLVFPPKDDEEKWSVISHFFVPAENIMDRSKRDNVPYDQWKQQKLITATEGNAVDYDYIEQRIIDAAKDYDLREVAYDPWGAVDLATRLAKNEGIHMEPCRQGFKTMSPALKRLLGLVLEGKLAHGGHPVLRWNADNLVVQTDHIENVKPHKEKAKERIDGIVALAMAVNSAINNFKPQSPYSDRGIRTLDW